MGFALTGIGGLLALNRTVNADAVRDGLRDGVLDSVLFVKDPVHNATGSCPRWTGSSRWPPTGW